MSATPGGDFPQGMPSPDTLQTTLRRLTETLAIEVARPSATAPDWSDSEWLLARAVAAIHGISPLLSRSLRWRGAVPAGKTFWTISAYIPSTATRVFETS